MARDPHIRAFLVWSRMPLVVEQGGRAYLTDQRFYASVRSGNVPAFLRSRRPLFLLPLDKVQSNS